MKTLVTERNGAVQTVWLNNPPYNFLTAAVMDELLEYFQALDGDDEVRAVVLTSAIEDVFVTHYDVAEILAGVESAPMTLTPHTAAAALRASKVAELMPGGRSVMAAVGAAGVADLRKYHQVCRVMRESSMAFVAAINGRALGGGCELALACDIRLMADGPYEIGQPEILVGITPGGGGTQMLTRVLGSARAVEMCLEGAPITAQEAHAIGLVHHLVPRADTVSEAQTTATRLARRSPTAIAAVKRAVYEGGSTSLEKGLHIERSGFLAAASTESAKRAMRTYVDQVDEFQSSGRKLGDFVADQLPAWIEGTEVEFTE